MSNTDSLGLSADDICRIIKHCKGAQVSELTFQGLSLKFHPYRNEGAALPRKGTDQSTVSEDFSTTEDKADAAYLDEDAMIEAEEAQLMIDNPLAFERSQIAKSIERTRTQ
jgi:hypothetical protein